MTLNDFVATMLRNRELEDTRITDLDSYKAAVGASPEREYTDTVRDAMARYERERGTYGNAGEVLGRMNLADSGYAEALLRSAESVRDTDIARAGNELQKESLVLARDYAEHLQKEEADNRSLFDSVVKKLAAIPGVTKKAAYDYAVLSGLGDEDASVISEMAEGLWQNERRKTALEEVTRYGLRYDAALKYAKASGFDEAEAREIAAAAESIWQEANDRHYNYY